MKEWVDPQWLDVLLKIGACILAVSLLYAIIAYLFTKKTIYKTGLLTSGNSTDTFAYYYLPASLIKIAATAVVNIFKNQDGTIIDAKLKELSIIAAVEKLPDTRQLLRIVYTPSAFAKDEIKISTNALGLLETSSSTVENRFTHIISTLFAAPTNILQTKAGEDIAPPDAMGETVETVETKEFKREFTIVPAKVKNGGGDTFNWIITEPGFPNPVDASFKIDLAAIFENPTPSTHTLQEANGIYARPPIALDAKVSAANGNQLDQINGTSVTITVPDITQAILIPVTRSLLVQKKQDLKFLDGTLQENSITKPSEAEAFLSIPVDILKAIFAIPAQLLSFRINHIQQQKSFITEDSNLIKAEIEREKTRVGTDAELLKAKLDAQKTAASFEQDLLKAKMDTQKATLEAQKDILTAHKDVLKAQQELIEQQKLLNELLKKKD
ncbi:MAG: hypothetical protein WCF67_24015 [Chitinophagaceae bacterium]